MKENVKRLKNYLSTFHKNTQKHLWFNVKTSKWYYLTNIYNDAWVNEVKETHNVVVELDFNTTTFKDDFFIIFKPLLDHLKYDFNHYVFKVNVLNKYLNDYLKLKDNTPDIDPYKSVIFSNLDLEIIMDGLLSKFDKEQIIQTIQIPIEQIHHSDVSFLKIPDIKCSVPLKSGLNYVNTGFLKTVENPIMECNVYRITEKVFAYSFVFTTENLRATFYQPFRLFL